MSASVDELARALALNRIMQDEVMAAIGGVEQAQTRLRSRLREARLELQRLRSERLKLPVARPDAAPTRRRTRPVAETFFDAGPGATPRYPEPNADVEHARRIFRGVPVGGMSEQPLVWSKLWKDELGRAVTQQLRQRLMSAPRAGGTGPAAPERALGLRAAEPDSTAMVPFSCAPEQPQPRTARAGGQAAVAFAMAARESERIRSLPTADLVRAVEAVGGMDERFWADVSEVLCAESHGASDAGAAGGAAGSAAPDARHVFTAAECARAWGRHPENPLVRLSSEWTQDEERRLVELAKDGTRSWVEIAREHGHRQPAARPLIELLSRYQRVLNPRMIKSAWSAEEDAQLRAAVEQYGRGNWQQIADAMRYRTNQQCMQRWRTLAPNRRAGRWEPSEDVLLGASVAVHSTEALRARTVPLGTSATTTFHRALQWNRVQLTVPGRTDAQCRERYMNVLDPLLLKQAAEAELWTEAADRRLSELVNAHWRPDAGCGVWTLVPWSKVAAAMGPYTDQQCRTRFFAMLATESQRRQYAELRRLRQAVLPSNLVGRRDKTPPALTPESFRLAPAVEGAQPNGGEALALEAARASASADAAPTTTVALGEPIAGRRGRGKGLDAAGGCAPASRGKTRRTKRGASSSADVQPPDTLPVALAVPIPPPSAPCDPSLCALCNKGFGRRYTVECHGPCGRTYHLACANLPVEAAARVGSWWCPACTAQGARLGTRLGAGAQPRRDGRGSCAALIRAAEAAQAATDGAAEDVSDEVSDEVDDEVDEGVGAAPSHARGSASARDACALPVPPPTARAALPSPAGAPQAASRPGMAGADERAPPPDTAGGRSPPRPAKRTRRGSPTAAHALQPPQHPQPSGIRSSHRLASRSATSPSYSWRC